MYYYYINQPNKNVKKHKKTSDVKKEINPPITLEEDEQDIDENYESEELQKETLKPFLDSGILQPGVDILEYQYNHINYRASLMYNGKIRDGNLVKYTTPTEWGNSVIVY